MLIQFFENEKVMGIILLTGLINDGLWWILELKMNYDYFDYPNQLFSRMNTNLKYFSLENPAFINDMSLTHSSNLDHIVGNIFGCLLEQSYEKLIILKKQNIKFF